MAAFTISAEQLATQSHIGDLYRYLSDFANFAAILPEDKVENFTFDAQQCSFTIKGITAMTVRIKEKQEDKFIRFESQGLARFNFLLQVNFEGQGNANGTCQIDLLADLNPFIKSMAEKPLTTLVTTMNTKLSQLVIKQV